MITDKLHIITEATSFITGLNNNSDILALLEPEGFTADTLTEGQTKLQAAKEAQTAKTNAEGNTSATKTARNTAKKELTEYQKKLKKRVKTIGVQHQILLDRLPVQGNFPQSLEGLITLSRDMLKICLENEEIKAILAANGYPETRLQEGQTLLSNLETNQQAFIESKGAKQQATANLNNALKALKLWYKIAKEAATAAIENDKQLLEKLGIIM